MHCALSLPFKQDHQLPPPGTHAPHAWSQAFQLTLTLLLRTHTCLQVPGTLEAHANGFRYTNPRHPNEPVHVMYRNIRHAIFQVSLLCLAYRRCHSCFLVCMRALAHITCSVCLALEGARSHMDQLPKSPRSLDSLMSPCVLTRVLTILCALPAHYPCSPQRMR